MRVNVLFYARLADLTGRREWGPEVPDGSTVGGVWQASVEAFPALGAMSGRVSCAVNAEFARLESHLSEHDEVAFLPPVSGGAGNGQ